jgi:hypothetical protein
MELAAMTAERILRSWEQALDAPPPRQAITILDCAGALSGVADPRGLSIGQRDAGLLRLRALTFGPTMHMRINCPNCAQTVTAGVDVADVEASGTATPGEIVRELRKAGWTLRYRLPTAGDLDDASHAAGVAQAAALLLRRCVLHADHDGDPADPAALPPALRDALSAAIEAWDPLVETALAIDCTSCGHGWHAVLEIASFLHAEIADTAIRVVREVDELARRYGWREADILAMTATRRQAYLEQTG